MNERKIRQEKSPFANLINRMIEKPKESYMRELMNHVDDIIQELHNRKMNMKGPRDEILSLIKTVEGFRNNWFSEKDMGGEEGYGPLKESDVKFLILLKGILEAVRD